MNSPGDSESPGESSPGGFSAVGNAPWGIIHNGIDFLPAKNLTAFRSVSTGVVSDISMWKNDISLKWQVNVRIRFNSTYTLEYIFETFSANQADGQGQLSYLNISVGKTLLSGDPIGQLFTAGAGSHLHLMLWKDGTATFPDGYFSQEARSSVLNLIHLTYPNCALCY